MKVVKIVKIVKLYENVEGIRSYRALVGNWGKRIECRFHFIENDKPMHFYRKNKFILFYFGGHFMDLGIKNMNSIIAIFWKMGQCQRLSLLGFTCLDLSSLYYINKCQVALSIYL